MAEEITFEKVQDTIATAPAAAKALAAVFQQAATEYIEPLDMFLEVLGLKAVIPATWLVQPVMTLAEKHFGKITREEWIQLYDDMEALEKVLTEHPEIRENYQKNNEEALADQLVAELGLELPEF